MAWVVVPCLNELRDQLDEVAPGRDRASDGSIGDTSHSAGKSSHNPDRTGNPEHRDGDQADEVRARDFDADLRTPGLTMLEVVRHLVTGARAGRFWWLRYIIFQGIIYSRSTEPAWQARKYTGANSHHHHAHVNSNFTQAADTVRGTDYGLEELVPVSKQNVIDALQSPEGKAAIWAAFNQDRIQGYDENGVALPEDPKDPAANDMTVASALALAVRMGRMSEAQIRKGVAQLNAAVAAGRVDVGELATALAPSVATLVVAQLPASGDPVSQAEVTEAFRVALVQAFAPKQG